MKTKHHYSNSARSFNQAQKGMSLVELMISMVIGLFLIAGASQVYVNSRRTYADNEGIARLQETARYALSVIEPDIRMAGYWGLTKRSGQIFANPALVAPTSCGATYATTLDPFITGSNNAYAMGTGWGAACGAFNNAPVASADTLTIRRASNQRVVASSAGTIQVCTSRGGFGSLIDGTACPNAGLAASSSSQLSSLIVRGYYIAQDSTGIMGLPSLRRKDLQSGAPNAQFNDVEIVPGVEDMQIQFGIDTGQGNTNGASGQVSFYINPADVTTLAATFPDAQVASVRVWLLIRSETPELGFVDGRIYTYADRTAGATGSLNPAAAAGVAYQPALNTANGRFRRLLVSRNFQIRNAIGT